MTATLKQPPVVRDYEALLACYLSGQMNEAQWQEHLAEDEVLRRWWLRRRGAHG